jgi:transcriptional regulator with XRE-family HTH domain
MDIRGYLDKHKLTQRKLARRANMDESKLSRVIRGEIRATADVALALYEATDREVPLEAILRRPEAA